MALDYALANELKDAGFPQGGNGTWIGDPDSLVRRREDRAYVPTLEELLDVYGAGPIDLHSETVDGARIWFARSGENYSGLAAETVREAIARLWLASLK